MPSRGEGAAETRRLSGNRLLLVYTHEARKRQGVLCLDVESGDTLGSFLDPEFPVIHNMVANEDVVILLTGNRVPGPLARRGKEELRLQAFSPSSGEATPLWRETVANESVDELPDVSIALDSGKLYIARGAMLEVRDGLTGRVLGDVTLPGLDERVAWQISQGAGLLAEENRASVFEVPA